MQAVGVEDVEDQLTVATRTMYLQAQAATLGINWEGLLAKLPEIVAFLRMLWELLRG